MIIYAYISYPSPARSLVGSLLDMFQRPRTLTPFILIQGISQPHAICQSPNARMQGQTPKTKSLIVDQKAPGDVNSSCSLKEVFASAAAACRNGTLVLWDGREDGKLWIEIFSDIHNGGHITAAIAVIGRRPDGNNRLLLEMILHGVRIRFTFMSRTVLSYLITLIDKLMSTSNKFKSINLVKLGCYFVSKQPSSPTRRNGPGFHIFRITPDQVTKRTLVRNLLGAGDDADLI